MTNPHRFSFGVYGEGPPPLVYTIFRFSIENHREPGDAWFKPIVDRPYGGGLPNRIRKTTFKILKHTFNYHSLLMYNRLINKTRASFFNFKSMGVIKETL